MKRCIDFMRFKLSLQAPVERELQHTREVTFRGYKRKDGLWDIEADIRDTKTQVFVIQNERTWQAGEPIHDMTIRLTLDDEMVVKDIDVFMKGVPHHECPKAQAPMHLMIGSSIGSGWRKAIDKNLGGIKGCTHLRELLYSMATAAFQTIPASFSMPTDGRPPMHLGKCLAWDFNGEAVKVHHPEFVGWTEASKPNKVG